MGFFYPKKGVLFKRNDQINCCVSARFLSACTITNSNGLGKVQLKKPWVDIIRSSIPNLYKGLVTNKE